MNLRTDDALRQTPDLQKLAPALVSATQPFYWSLRREFWEYRSIYLAPLGAAALALIGFLISAVGLPAKMRSIALLDPAQQHEAIATPYNLAAGLILGAAFIVSIFYSLDSLYGERRDRSILFWKSLPVSDLTTVLAKAAIPLAVLPLLSFVVTFLTESIILLLNSGVLLASGQSPTLMWSRLEFFETSFGLLYHLVTVHILWYAPLYAWLLLISAWARRAPFLWAALPPFAIVVFEHHALHSSHFTDFLGYRISGGRAAVDNMQGSLPFHPGMHFTPGLFLVSPGLWGGLIFAALFLFAAARLRRYRQPV